MSEQKSKKDIANELNKNFQRWLDTLPAEESTKKKYEKQLFSITQKADIDKLENLNEILVKMAEVPEEKKIPFYNSLLREFYNYNIYREPTKRIAAAEFSVSQAEPENIQQVTASALELNSAYYESVLDQAKQSFKWALIATVVGFLFFLAAVGIILFRENLEISVISLIAGTLVEVIAGLNFYLYGQTTQQLGNYHTRLDSIQRFMIANSLCEQLQNKNKDRARITIIEKITGASIVEEDKQELLQKEDQE